MLGILKKLFAGNSVQTDALPPADELTSMPIELGKTGQFLRREAVFDRNNRLSGHIFYLQQSPLLANADDAQQRNFDKLLIETLNASPEAWNTSLAFIPLSSASLDLDGLERLKTSNIVLLVQLAADAEAEIVCDAIDQLFLRGFHVGIFRQPKIRHLRRPFIAPTTLSLTSMPTKRKPPVAFRRPFVPAESNAPFTCWR